MVARFWAEALGWRIMDEADGDVEIADPAGRDRPILFQTVPEAKMAKNRWHLDLRAVTSMAAEVERLVQAGAIERERVDERGNYWTVLHDPEGNEFCVLRGPEDGWSPPERGTA